MRLAICGFAISAGLATAMPCLADEAPPDTDIVQAGGLTALVPVSSHSITAHLRKVRLSSGDQWTVDLYGDRLVGFQLDNDAVPAGQADGAVIDISLKDAKTILASAVNLDGVAISSASHIKGTAIVLNTPQMPGQQQVSVATRTHPHLSVLLKQFQARMAKNRRPPSPVSSAPLPLPATMPPMPGTPPPAPTMPRPAKAG